MGIKHVYIQTRNIQTYRIVSYVNSTYRRVTKCTTYIIQLWNTG